MTDFHRKKQFFAAFHLCLQRQCPVSAVFEGSAGKEAGSAAGGLFPEVFMTKMVEVMAAMVSVHSSLGGTPHKPVWPPANETSSFTAM